MKHKLSLTLLLHAAFAFTVTAADPPRISSVVSAASLRPAAAPGSLAVILGERLADLSESWSGIGEPPAQLAGRQVRIAGFIAPLRSVSPNRIEFLVPPDLELGQASLRLEDADGIPLALNFLNLSKTAPGLFSLDRSGAGPADATQADTGAGAPFSVLYTDEEGRQSSVRIRLKASGVRAAAAASTPPDTPAPPIALLGVRAGQSPEEWPIESVAPAPDALGEDQVVFALPAGWDGQGEIQLALKIDGEVSNFVTILVRSLNPPKISAFTPESVQPGAKFSIIGESFATNAPQARNRVRLSFGDGQSVTIAPLNGDSSRLDVLAPPLPGDAPESWYQGPVGVCVLTDGQEACAPQELMIAAAAEPPGSPGEFLKSYTAAANGKAIESLRAAGQETLAADLSPLAYKLQAELEQMVADAQAGNPRTIHIELPGGESFDAVQDLASIRRLETLLYAGSQTPATSLAQSPPRSAIDWSGEDALMRISDRRRELKSQSIQLSAAHFGLAAGSWVLCGAFPPACPAAVTATAALAIPWTVAALVLNAEMFAIDLQPNYLQELSLSPSGPFALPLAAEQPIDVRGKFVPVYAGVGLADAAPRLLKPVVDTWVSANVPPQAQPLASETMTSLISLSVKLMLDAGLDQIVKIDLPIAQRTISLSWNTVTSDCIRGSSPSADASFFLDSVWVFKALRPMDSPVTCTFVPRGEGWQGYPLLAAGGFPTVSTSIQVKSSENAACGSLPSYTFRPLAKVDYTSKPINGGDKLVVGSLTTEMYNTLRGGYGSNAPLPLPRFAGETYCHPVQLASGCSAVTYVPTADERVGKFPDFANLLLDPMMAPLEIPFPGGIIPMSRQGPMSGVAAWRVKSVQGCGPQK